MAEPKQLKMYILTNTQLIQLLRMLSQLKYLKYQVAQGFIVGYISSQKSLMKCLKVL